MYSRILVPLDGSEVSAQVLPYARLLAQATGARLDLLQAVPDLETIARLRTASRFGTSGLEQWQAQQERARAAAQEQLASAATAIDAPGVVVETLVTAGEPAEAIVQESVREPDTLIAMTTHGRSGIGRWLMGSVADKVIHHATVPVLLVRAREAPPASAQVERIILPLDGSTVAEQAIPTAVALSKALGAPITVLQAISLAIYGFGFEDYSVPAYSMGEFAAAERADVKEYVDEVVRELREEGVPGVEASIPDGDAADAIIREAEDTPNSLVVMTTHGRSGLGRWVLGSVADKTVRHSPCPVLVIRAQEQETEEASPSLT